jgi:hypothetical protein
MRIYLTAPLDTFLGVLQIPPSICTSQAPTAYAGGFACWGTGRRHITPVL